MSCVDEAVDELQSLGTTLEQRLVWVGADRSELDQTILDWVKGLSACADLLEAAIRKCKHAACVDEAAAAIVRYLNLELPEELVWASIASLKDAALDLCVDESNREHKVEIRRLLSENLEHLLEEGRGREGLEEVNAFALRLSEGLCGLGGEEGIPRFVREHWCEWKELLAGGQLPLGGPIAALEPTLASRALRRFLQRAFLKPSVSELPAHQRLSPGELAIECETCADVQCILADGSSGAVLGGECVVARSLAVNNAGLTTQPPDGPLHHYYDAVIGRNEKLLTERLYKQRRHSETGWRFCVLQRWNSYTPALGTSEGGGYFLYRVPEADDEEMSTGETIDAGIVIDPGYGFLRNFFSQGFGVRDVSGVIVTHDHPDHLVDFEPLVNLLLEAKKDRVGGGQSAGSRKVDALLSGGAFERLNPSIETTRVVFRDTFVRTPGKDGFTDPVAFHDVDGNPINTSLKVEAKLAIHKDASELPQRDGYDSIGVLIEVSARGETARIAIPSDTQWSNEVAAQYLTLGSHADAICLHLGAMAKKSKFGVFEYYSTEKTGRDVVHKGWHLYLPGILWFIEAAADVVRASGDERAVLVVLSEFGEEMSHGLRADLANRLNRHMRESAGTGTPPVVVAPGDVGLVIDPISRKIKCSCCGDYYSWEMPFRFEVFGDCEQIFYVCAECDSLLADDEKRGIFRQRQAPLGRPVTA